MTSYQQRLRAFMDRGFAAHRRLSPGQVELSSMRVLQQLRRNPEWQWQSGPSDHSHPAAKTSGAPDAAQQSRRRAGTLAVAVAATLLAVMAVPVIRDIVSRRGAIATVEIGDGSLYRVAAAETVALKTAARIAWGDVVRSDGQGCTLALSDGSKVEMRAQAELSLERADDGVKIRLRSGSIIVTAAKQRDGHLYVQTKDLTVSVVGTVFLVSAEEDGSRVAVVEGVVRVRENDTETSLRPGEQISTGLIHDTRAVKDEIAWSRDVTRHLSLLAVSVSVIAQQAPPAAPPPATGAATQNTGTATTPPPSGRGGNPNAPIGSPPGLSGAILEPPALSAPNVGAGTISGVVRDAATGLPLEGARVSLSASGLTGHPLVNRPPQLTDSKGRFIFPRLLPSAGYWLNASRPGYLSGGYQKIPGISESTVRLTDGEWLRDADIKLWRPSAISGSVRDERGEPLVGVPIRILVGATVAGRFRWAGGPITQTDDRGMYRFAGLSSGRYLVHVPGIQITLPSGEAALYRPPSNPAGSNQGDALHVVRGADGSGVLAGLFPDVPPDDKGSMYPSVSYPAARSVDQADPIVLGFGTDRAGVDIHMNPVPSVSISGTVAGPADAIGGLPVRIFPTGNEPLGQSADAGLTTTDAAGRFIFHRIPTGDYVIVASRSVADYRAVGSGTDSSIRALVPVEANPFGVSQSLTSNNGILLAPSRVRGGIDVTGRLPVSVGNRPLTGLVVPVIPTVSVSGSLEWDGSDTPPAALSQSIIFVILEPADGDVSLGQSLVSAQTNGGPTRTFTFENVKPGRYVFADVTARVASAGSAFPVITHRLVGATWNGRDVIQTPLDVSGDGQVTGIVLKMSTQVNRVTGTVRGADGRVATEGTVVAFPPAPSALLESGLSAIRFPTTPIANDGTYELPPMIPGDYLLAAIPWEDQVRWLEPEYLAALAREATRVSLGPASAVSEELRVVTVRRSRQ